MAPNDFYPDRNAAGFTLLEILTVIAVIAILTGILVPSIGHISEGMRLTQAGRLVANEINLARATALARSQPTEVWFLQMPDAANGGMIYRALRTRQLESSGAENWISKIQHLPQAMVIAADATRSNCIGAQTPQSISDVPGVQEGVGLRIFPNGRTELINATAPMTMGDAFFLTIGRMRDMEKSDLPPNFITVLVDPRTGKVTTYRP